MLIRYINTGIKNQGLVFSVKPFAEKGKHIIKKRSMRFNLTSPLSNFFR